MKSRISKIWVYLLVAVVLGVGVVVTGMNLMRPKGRFSGVAPLLQEKSAELEEKDRQIQDLNIQIAQLKEELGFSSRQVADLKSRLQAANRELAAVQQKLKSAEERAGRLAVRQPTPPPVAHPAPSPGPSPEYRRGPAEPGTYETLRPTPVFESPSGSSREVAIIRKGTKVTVVGSSGEWLEIRSKHGNPPGFIRRDDAMFIGKSG